MKEIIERLLKRAKEIEDHVSRVPGYYPEAIQHAKDLRAICAEVENE